MMEDRVYILPNETGPTEAVAIDTERCIGCNACANICRTQTILQNPVKGKPPLLVYPDECWFCACCVEVCPTGALQMRQPIGRRILFKRKATGEVFRIGQKDPPEKSFFRPPYGELKKTISDDIWLALNNKSLKTIAVLPLPACTETAKIFGWQDVPEKMVALLHNMGFNMVFKGAEGELNVSSLREGDKKLFIAGFTDNGLNCGYVGADAILTAKELAEMIKRACVSMYTAVHVWDELPQAEFDQPVM